jgi:hypothetical protein
MISFTDHSFIVEVETGIIAHDNWRMTVDEIIDALQAQDTDMRGEKNYYYLLELLRQMLPSEKQIKQLN